MKKCKCCCNDAQNLGCFDVCNLPRMLDLDFQINDGEKYQMSICWGDNRYEHPTKFTGIGEARLSLDFSEIICNIANTLYCYYLILTNCETGEKKCYEFSLFRGC